MDFDISILNFIFSHIVWIETCVCNSNVTDVITRFEWLQIFPPSNLKYLSGNFFRPTLWKEGQNPPHLIDLLTESVKRGGQHNKTHHQHLSDLLSDKLKSLISFCLFDWLASSSSFIFSFLSFLVIPTPWVNRKKENLYERTNDITRTTEDKDHLYTKTVTIYRRICDLAWSFVVFSWATHHRLRIRLPRRQRRPQIYRPPHRLQRRHHHQNPHPLP